ncbi:hypothetical protein [Streptomyces sp. NPDC060333]|uniref:hypothetical protein n=1 Tax=Streptomyces sp. NPDC060333 TaxID=3347098 RepID=UPI0036627894
MTNFQINKGHGHGRTVTADHFETVGEFVDFFEGAEDGSAVILRVRASNVITIERID